MASPTRSAAIALLLMAVLSISACSQSEPVGLNRAQLPAPALSGTCWPLPDDVRFSFSLQARSERHVRTADGNRIVFTLQYDLTSGDAVRTTVDDALSTAGFTSLRRIGNWSYYERAGYGLVGRRVTPLADVPDDNIVRGTIDLDLPAAAVAKERRQGCSRLPDLSTNPGRAR
jgi:hypothetical protein